MVHSVYSFNIEFLYFFIIQHDLACVCVCVLWHTRWTLCYCVTSLTTSPLKLMACNPKTGAQSQYRYLFLQLRCYIFSARFYYQKNMASYLYEHDICTRTGSYLCITLLRNWAYVFSIHSFPLSSISPVWKGHGEMMLMRMWNALVCPNSMQTSGTKGVESQEGN